MTQNYQSSISRSPWPCFCVALWKAGCPRYETKVTIATTNSISHLPTHSVLPIWRASHSAGGVPTVLQLNSLTSREKGKGTSRRWKSKEKWYLWDSRSTKSRERQGVHREWIKDYWQRGVHSPLAFLSIAKNLDYRYVFFSDLKYL